MGILIIMLSIPGFTVANFHSFCPCGHTVLPFLFLSTDHGRAFGKHGIFKKLNSFAGESLCQEGCVPP